MKEGSDLKAHSLLIPSEVCFILEKYAALSEKIIRLS